MTSNQVGFWDSKERKGALSQEADEARRIAREMYHKWVLFKEAALRQQSREVWLEEGDRDTKLFYKLINTHIRRHVLVRIKINGVWISEENGIKEAVVLAFCNLLSNIEEWRPNIDELTFEALSGRKQENWSRHS